MFDLHVFKSVPLAVALLATSALNVTMGKCYAHGDGPWSEEARVNVGLDRFSSNATRAAVHNSWCLSNPDLQVGNLTYGWLHQATKSCAAVQKKKTLAAIETHCLIATAGQDDLVDNKAAVMVAGGLQNGHLIDYPDARHEILMEDDTIRDDFLEHFYKLVKECIIDRPETLKPF